MRSVWAAFSTRCPVDSENRALREASAIESPAERASKYFLRCTALTAIAECRG